MRMLYHFRLPSLCLVVLLFSACGGSETSAPVNVPTAPPPVVTPPSPEKTIAEKQVEAARLLSQATFGVRMQDIDALVNLGPDKWLEQQLGMPASYHLPYFENLQNQIPRDEMWRAHRVEAWWQHSIFAEDQLRQRVAFALSELMVVSEKSNLFDDFEGLLGYYDILVKHAFGNYRDLLEEVTLSPIMGMYLSMLGNEKADIARNIRPDENYARELMQLFSIGLVELNLDGSPKLDAQNQTIATYDQEIIENFAKVFTGWHFNGTSEETWHRWWQNYNTQLPMTAVESYHDRSEKHLLNGLVLPAEQSAYADLSAALDNIFAHQNLAPFVARHLIQRLVSSNPSRDYVQRVAQVFNDNGQGIRGDLAAVVKAVLSDQEALSGHQTMPERFGKMREPIIKATHLWRAFNASSPNGRIELGWPDYFFNQAPLASPSVFNFFLPDHTTPGALAEQDLVVPELQIMTETFVVRTTNFLAYYALWGHSQHDREFSEHDIIVDYSAEAALIDSPDELIQRLNLLLLSGSMSESYKAILLEAIEEAQQSQVPAHEQIANLVFLIMSSPQYAVQQ